MRKFVLVVLCVLTINAHYAQSVAVGTPTPDNSAVLDVSSTTKGMLVPRMTLAQRNAIPSPAPGLIIYQTNSNAGFYYNAGGLGTPSWVLLIASATSGSPGQFLTLNNLGNPQWANLGQSGATVYGNAPVTVSSSAFVLVPGLTYTLSVPANSVVQINTTGGAMSTSGVATANSVVDVVLYIDGALVPNGGYQRMQINNTAGLTGIYQYWSLALTQTFAGGTHTISVMANLSSGSPATVSGNNSTVLQGSLSVTVIRQ